MGDISTNLQVLDRTFKIIDVLAPVTALSVSEISSKTGLYKSTVYRFLDALIQHGYVEKTDTGLYKIGIKFVTVAGYYINKLELITSAQPYLWELATKLNLSVFMSIQDGADIIYIARADIFRMRQIYTDIGMRAPAISTAMGKCLLAQLSDKALEMTLSHKGIVKLTSHTITDMKELKKELHEIRLRGYAIDDQEFNENIRCIAAPVYDYCGDVVAAICASGTCSQLPAEYYEKYSEVVVEMADNISRKLGYN